jgi:hypothetical protein
VEFHKSPYPWGEYRETMELIDEEFKDYRDRFSRRYGPR